MCDIISLKPISVTAVMINCIVAGKLSADQQFADVKCEKTMNEEKYTPQISVIVPVYNTDEYLEECITSIRVQSFDNIEIILIDDGSSDNSAEICDDMAAADPRIRVRHNNHKGIAATRNDGLSMARGKYIMFVDSDDWIDVNFCETPYTVAEKNNSDLVIFQLWKYGYEDLLLKDQDTSLEEGPADQRTVLVEYWDSVGSYSVNKLFRKELFNGIRYPNGEYYEDVAILYKVIHEAPRIYMLPDRLYHYRNTRKGSITNTNTEQYRYFFYKNEFKRLKNLNNWGIECSDETVRTALNYLLQFGDNAPETAYCMQLIKEASSFPKKESLKKRIMFHMFRISPKCFYMVSSLTGRRLPK